VISVFRKMNATIVYMAENTGTMTLFRRRQAPYHLCAKLRELTEAAAHVYTLREDLFKALVDARNKQLKNSLRTVRLRALRSGHWEARLQWA